METLGIGGVTSPRSAEIVTTDGKAITRMKTEKILFYPWDGFAFRGISIVAGLSESRVRVWSRRQPILGLKGQNIVAQGNALGSKKQQSVSPERALQMSVNESFVTPFQG